MHITRIENISEGSKFVPMVTTESHRFIPRVKNYSNREVLCYAIHSDMPHDNTIHSDVTSYKLHCYGFSVLILSITKHTTMASV